MRYFLFAILTFVLFGCTTAQRIGDNEDAWVAETTSYFHLLYSTQYYYCRSNKSEDGRNVQPKCYEAAKLKRYIAADLPQDTTTNKKSKKTNDGDNE